MHRAPVLGQAPIGRNVVGRLPSHARIHLVAATRHHAIIAVRLVGLKSLEAERQTPTGVTRALAGVTYVDRHIVADGLGAAGHDNHRLGCANYVSRLSWIQNTRRAH